jgi:hypothetical protein
LGPGRIGRRTFVAITTSSRSAKSFSARPTISSLESCEYRLAHVLHAATSDRLVGETYGPVIGAITLLLPVLRGDGSIRSDLDPDDVLLMMGFLWRLDPSDDWEARASRMLDLAMDGLRAKPPTGPHTSP